MCWRRQLHTRSGSVVAGAPALTRPPPWSQASSAAAPSALASLRTPSCTSSRSSTRSRRRQMHMPMPRHNHRHSVRCVPPAAGLVHLVVPRRVQLRALPARANPNPNPHPNPNPNPNPKPNPNPNPNPDPNPNPNPNQATLTLILPLPLTLALTRRGTRPRRAPLCCGPSRPPRASSSSPVAVPTAGTGRRAAALDLASRLPLVRPRLTVDPVS